MIYLYGIIETIQYEYDDGHWYCFGGEGVSKPSVNTYTTISKNLNNSIFIDEIYSETKYMENELFFYDKDKKFYRIFDVCLDTNGNSHILINKICKTVDMVEDKVSAYNLYENRMKEIRKMNPIKRWIMGL